MDIKAIQAKIAIASMKVKENCAYAVGHNRAVDEIIKIINNLWKEKSK